MSSGGEGLGITGSLADAHSRHPGFTFKPLYFGILKLKWVRRSVLFSSLPLLGSKEVIYGIDGTIDGSTLNQV